ncbi:MAG: HAD family phosphatase [Bacteroidetes bacterium]|nr:HAD family phosphatase [Bacteroidota bacterium]MDA1120253.1 HAD family phosphatase [Bacteroidota bacterium]
MKKGFAVIFDMDGVLVDNNPVHVETWKIYADRLEFELTPEKIKNDLYGRTNADAFRRLYNPDLTDRQCAKLSQEKEALYREIYKETIHPVDGLIDFLSEIKEMFVPMVIATSAIPENVEFVTKMLGIADYFQFVINETHVTKGKPDPEVYLITVEKLGLPAKNCVVIEDSLSGVQAGISAGCKVVGLTTSHSAIELAHTDKVINDFTEINYELLHDLVSGSNVLGHNRIR